MNEVLLNSQSKICLLTHVFPDRRKYNLHLQYHE